MTQTNQVSVTIIDGRSGSGKTTFAADLAASLDAQTLQLDVLYPGWGGLSEGSRSVSVVLREGRYRPYDWETNEFRAEWVALDSARSLVIEGCGALTRENLVAAREWGGRGSEVQSIWLECDAGLRKARALARDGEMFAPHWGQWAEQEDGYYAVHTPWEIADEIVVSE